MTHKYLRVDHSGKPSSWLLIFGIFLCCTIALLPAGLVMVFLYFWKDHHSMDGKFYANQLGEEERKQAM
jgi:hypothetical protein